MSSCIPASPFFISSILTGDVNFTCIRVPPEKSTPYFGPLCIIREIIVIIINTVEIKKAVFLLLVKSILISGFINYIN